ncbi:twin-arginine translocase TatA/TatE family subunit [Oceanicoccus sp. KOV_DT_Chl]|uniref:twin-arginine translocase TatA/TatE family subunit n=1 Tax=Oceanicoccus sp. KOV_DT_Chl TaxID=1904639 RepID=UPI000C7A5860|nr:twin-arginine translocase TatA/TatE family subunit [Oceanicoccus sp. KOV_DT_Chl]
MGLGGISIWQLLIILAIVVMLFGTKRLRNLGGDLGAAIKGFRSSIADDDKDKKEDDEASESIDADDTSADKNKQ